MKVPYRHRLVAKRTRVKNGLRSLLRGHGIEHAAGKKLWSRKGVAWLAEVAFPTGIDAIQRDMKLESWPCWKNRFSWWKKSWTRSPKSIPVFTC